MGQTKAYKPQIKMQYNAAKQQQQLPARIKLKAIVNFLTEVILSIHLSNVCLSECLCFSLCFGGCHK